MTTIEPNPSALVASFSEASARVTAMFRLQALGADALPAIREGLKHPDWHVRHWCAICLDRTGTADVLGDLVPLLRDPEMNVRLWAVHSLACDQCKPYECAIDVVPMLVERLEQDASVRVRKMAAAMLCLQPLDPRARPALEAALARETDPKMRLHTERALARYRD